MHLGEEYQPQIGEYEPDLVMICFEEGIFLQGDSLNHVSKGESRVPEKSDFVSS